MAKKKGDKSQKVKRSKKKLTSQRLTVPPVEAVVEASHTNAPEDNELEVVSDSPRRRQRSEVRGRRNRSRSRERERSARSRSSRAVRSVRGQNSPRSDEFGRRYVEYRSQERERSSRRSPHQDREIEWRELQSRRFPGSRNTYSRDRDRHSRRSNTLMDVIREGRSNSVRLSHPTWRQRSSIRHTATSQGLLGNYRSTQPSRRRSSESDHGTLSDNS